MKIGQGCNIVLNYSDYLGTQRDECVSKQGETGLCDLKVFYITEVLVENEPGSVQSDNFPCDTGHVPKTTIIICDNDTPNCESHGKTIVQKAAHIRHPYSQVPMTNSSQ